MKVQKLFSSNAKPILQKPAYVKPKHRTYRQLLALDRPKKKVEIESDDQNDDFLKKILKEQVKKDKRKSSKKSKGKKDKPSSSSKGQGKKEVSASKENVNSQNIKANINLADLVSKEKKQAEQMKKPQIKTNQLTKPLKKQQASFEIQLIQEDQEQINVNQIQTIPNFDTSKVKFKYSQHFKRSASQKDVYNKDQIYIDQTSTQKYRILQQQNKVIKNNFFTNLKVKNMEGTIMLRARTHAHLIPNQNQSNLILTKVTQKNYANSNIYQDKLNPELKIKSQIDNKGKQIQHHLVNRFSSVQEFIHGGSEKVSVSQNYRRVVLKLAMMEISRMQKPLQQKRHINKEKLFKNEYQHSLFLKSLQTSK